MSSMLLLPLLYITVKAMQEFLRRDDIKAMFFAMGTLYLFVSNWLGLYQHIIEGFFAQVSFALNAVILVVVMGVLYIERLRLKEHREKLKTRDYFSRYMSPQIVKQLLKDERLRLGGEKRPVTVLFTDVRGFTKLSENLDPKDILNILNGHFDIINDEIFKMNGTMMKFIGDAAMAVFNIPYTQPDHAERAIRACINIQKRMKSYSAKVKKKYGIDFAIGIGINTGEVVVGNMGSHKYMDYTIIGDAVNTASRLNGVARKGEIVISESTYKQVIGKFRFSPPEEVSVKGKSKPIKVYRVLYE